VLNNLHRTVDLCDKQVGGIFMSSSVYNTRWPGDIDRTGWGRPRGPWSVMRGGGGHWIFKFLY